MVNDFFLFLAGSKIVPQCQNRKFAKNPKFIKRACAAPLGFTEQNQFLPTGMCVLSYTLSCFVQQFEKIYKLYSRTPLSLSPATLRKNNALYSVSQASTTHALTRSLTAKCSHSTACVWDIIGKRLQSFKVAKENCFQLLSWFHIIHKGSTIILNSVLH